MHTSSNSILAKLQAPLRCLVLVCLLAASLSRPGSGAKPALAQPLSVPTGLYLTLGTPKPTQVSHLELNNSLTTYFTLPSGSLTHFAFKPDDTLYYLDSNDRGVYYHTAKGEILYYNNSTYVRDLAFDSQGMLYISEASGGSKDGAIYTLTFDQKAQQVVKTLYLTVPLAKVGTYWGGNFAFDKSGNLYISNGNTGNAAIYQVMAGPTFKLFYQSTDPIDGFDFDTSGAIYYSDGGTSIYRLEAGNRLLVWTIPQGSRVPDVALSGAGPAPTRFQGAVTLEAGTGAQPGEQAALSPQAAPRPVAGVPLSLWGYPPANGKPVLLDSGVSGADGSYNLGTLQIGFDHYELTRGIARGAVLSSTASSASGATVIDPATVAFPTAPGLDCCTDFHLRDPLAAYPYLGPRYLIVTSAAVVPVLNDFIAYKRLLGYYVLVKTVENLDASGTGANRRDRIRNYEISLKSGLGGLSYVLLIGTDTTIPFLKMGVFGEDAYRHPWQHADSCGFIPSAPNTCGWPSDWYYVDLTSNWDSNGDGFLGEAFWPEHSTDRVDNPPGFNVDVALGRLLMDNPISVQTALHASMHFERDGGLWKKNVLMAGAMMEYDGRYWDPADNTITGTYQTSYKTDNGVLMERAWTDFLSTRGFMATRLYEKQHPPTGYVPSSLPSDAPISADEFWNRWTATQYGLVKSAGHGNDGGIVRRIWTTDIIPDGIVENPTTPLSDGAGHMVSQYELADYYFIDRSNSLASPDGIGPILMAMACDTGDVSHPDNLPSTLLSRGQISAWTGGTSAVGYIPAWANPADGWSQTIDYIITGKLAYDNLPLGQAVWKGLQQYSAMGIKDWSLINWDLYGDPSLSYWGNGPDLAAAWPMYHADWAGDGQTALEGPWLAERSWSHPIAAVPAAATAPSPVVGADNRVITGDANGVVYAYSQSGSLLWSVSTGPGPISNAPAISLDGTVYVKSGDGKLYAISKTGGIKWSALVGRSPASPKINGDGVIFVGGSDHGGPAGSERFFLYGYLPSGLRVASRQVDAMITTAPSLDPNGYLWLGTANGTLYRMSFNLTTVASFPIDPGYSLGNGLAWTPDHLLLVPSTHNRLVAWNTTFGIIEWSAVVSDSVTAPPAVGSDGKVIFGSHDGKLHAVRLIDGSRLWDADLGAGGSVDSAPASDGVYVYVVGGSPVAKLYAYSRATGSAAWATDLGGISTGASSPAIGFSHTLYITGKDGTLQAFIPFQFRIPPLIAHIIPQIGDISLKIAPSSPSDFIAVQRRIAGGDWTLLAGLQPGTTGFVDTQIQPGMVYSYRLIASGTMPSMKTPLLGVDDSDASLPITVQSLPALPGTPGTPSVTPLSSSSLRLTWAALDSNAFTITLERKDPGSQAFLPVLTLGAGITTTIDSGLAPGSLYSYRLVSYNPSGQSNPSPSASGSTFALSLAAPSHVTATPLGNGQMRVCWLPGGPNLSTVVARRSAGETTATVVANLAPGVSCVTDYGLYPVSFQYQVKHVSGQSESAWAYSSPTPTPSGGPVSRRIYLPVVKR
jgi:outer membrane protein assembly factor BamB